PSGQVFGGGPIMGVASSSKDKTIRKFNNKEHYNEWLFVMIPLTTARSSPDPISHRSWGKELASRLAQPTAQACRIRRPRDLETRGIQELVCSPCNRKILEQVHSST